MTDDVRVLAGDCLDVMAGLDEASVDAVCTDPPYGLGFMGHEWDQPGKFAAVRPNPHGPSHGGKWNRPGRTGPADRGSVVAGTYDLSTTANRRYQGWCEAWGAEALRVLKPGGHLVSFGGTRTFHRLTCGFEDAGAEIRDVLSWLYGQGFPKSLNLDGEWAGWGTALKPGWEPIVLARKPLDGTVAGNVAEHGTGALNIDAARITTSPSDAAAMERANTPGSGRMKSGGSPIGTFARSTPSGAMDTTQGRWPANVVLDEDAAAMLDAQTGTLTSGANPTRRGSDKFRNAYGDFEGQRECVPARGVDVGGASRFFYCAKAPASEKPWQQGQVGKEQCSTCGGWEYGNPACGCDTPTWVRNDESTMHPTVKPLDLMRWLVRLVTPPGGVILDPFAGTGTTGEAAVIEGFSAVLIEREPDYLALIDRRLSKPIQPTMLGGL